MIVIPMAGESRRFLQAGYEQPKYMLQLDGRPVFDWSVLSFRKMFTGSDFLFIARDIKGTAAFIQERLKVLGIRGAKVVLLESPTAGQAETVELGLKDASVSDAEPILIFNIDTMRPGFDMKDSPSDDGFLEVFRTTGDNWSFVEPDSNQFGRVKRCTEKQRISELCCTGLYFFDRVEYFRASLAAERRSPTSHELFVAPLYNHLIAGGLNISWREVPTNEVILCGVPKEYEELQKRSINGANWQVS
jgi:hypothetical protein